MRANGWFPDKQLKQAYRLARETKASLTGKASWWYYTSSDRDPASVIGPTPAMQPGLTLISGVNRHNSFARIIDADRRVLHEWKLDWFELAPEDLSYIDEDAIPRTRPGGIIHGMMLSPEGDLTFNFEQLALVKVDICGDLKWRLPQRTHHSLNEDEDGNIWTADVIVRQTADPKIPGYTPPFFDYRILQVSQEGKVLRTINVFDLLQRNGYRGLMYLDAIDDYSTRTTGDTLHLNDVEIFPADMTPGFADQGDLLVSLRNPNAIMLVDPDSLVIKQVLSGMYVRQHDPDFLDGSHMVVYDNNFLEAEQRYSRIIKVSLVDGSNSVIYQGRPGAHFESEVMGKQQPLPNGNFLITEATHGRVFEIDPNGSIVWEYLNWIEPGSLGRVSGAMRLTEAEMTADRLNALKARCDKR